MINEKRIGKDVQRTGLEQLVILCQRLVGGIEAEYDRTVMVAGL
jgi:hypothetical protein